MKILKFSLFVFLFYFGVFNLFSQEENEAILITKAIMEGSKASEEEISLLEMKLSEKPEDLYLRAKIIGYYFNKSIRDKNLRKKYQENVLWIIKNRPDSKLAGKPQCWLDPYLDGEVYGEGKRLWLENLEKFKENPQVLENAGNFFLIHDKEIAEEIFIKLQKIEPENPVYYEKLGHLYFMEMKRKEGEEKQKIAKKALFHYEKAHSLAEEEKKIYMLTELANLSLEAGEMGKAKEYSLELLKRAEEEKGEWFYGNAIHYGNIVLGKIALKENKKEEAKKYLIEAGKTPGSPQLNSFGPDFTLAEELLEAGEKEAVLKYLKLCEKFWESGKEKLKDWQVLIKGGRKPDFSKKF